MDAPATPSQADRLHDMGLGRLRDGDQEGAAQLFMAALGIDPAHARALNAFAVVARNMGKWETSCAAFERALKAAPNDFEIMFNYGRTLMGLERTEEALNVMFSALHHAPEGRPDIFHNLGLIYNRAGELEKGLAFFDRALELQPDNFVIGWDRALCLLGLGRYEEGWPGYDNSFKLYHPNILKVPIPLWNGEDLKGKRIWIYHDQGFGDTIMAARFLPEIARQAEVILDVPGELHRLLAGVVKPRPPGQPMPDCDYHLPVSSLAGRLTPKTISGAPCFAVPTGIAGEVERLPVFRRNVGIVWAGTGTHPLDAERSIAFEKILPLLGLSGISFFSLQVGPRAKEIHGNLANTLITDLGPLCHDFATTAGYLEQLDLLITVDTATAHLAGALGVPVWNLIAFNNDWRWGRGAPKRRTHWYDSMTLYQQVSPKSWPEVIARVSEDLIERFNL
jgi:tetratricopeptide (TPR) repeat protein